MSQVGRRELLAGERAQRLSLNPGVERARTSAAWIEAHYGRLWQQGREGLRRDNEITKPGPFCAALAEAADEAGTRFFGLQRECGLHGLSG